MRKHVKKLVLSRETLRSLEGKDVRGVAGGTNTVQTSCECFQATGCECGSGDCYSPTMCLWGCSLSQETCRC